MIKSSVYDIEDSTLRRVVISDMQISESICVIIVSEVPTSPVVNITS